MSATAETVTVTVTTADQSLHEQARAVLSKARLARKQAADLQAERSQIERAPDAKDRTTGQLTEATAARVAELGEELDATKQRATELEVQAASLAQRASEAELARATATCTAEEYLAVQAKVSEARHEVLLVRERMAVLEEHQAKADRSIAKARKGVRSCRAQAGGRPRQRPHQGCVDERRQAIEVARAAHETRQTAAAELQAAQRGLARKLALAREAEASAEADLRAVRAPYLRAEAEGAAERFLAAVTAVRAAYADLIGYGYMLTTAGDKRSLRDCLTAKAKVPSLPAMATHPLKGKPLFDTATIRADAEAKRLRDVYRAKGVEL